MVPVLVVLTFVAFVALDHFVLSKRHQESDSTQLARPEVRPLSAWSQPVPAGVFLQSTFTWSRLGEAGDVLLGVHPMLLELVGAPCEFVLRALGEQIEQGEPLVRMGRAGRHLTVRSPIAGRVDRVNRQATGETRWRGADGDEAWLYRLRPEHIAADAATWVAGAEAAAWTRRRYDDLRTYLHGAMTVGHLGAVMADGGELPVGILGELDQGVWAGLEDRFLAPEGTTREGRA